VKEAYHHYFHLCLSTSSVSNDTDKNWTTEGSSSNELSIHSASGGGAGPDRLG